MKEKYQVIKIGKYYIGVHSYEDLKTTTKTLYIFTEDAIKNEEAGRDIIEAIYLTENRRVIASYKK